ncbi:unnamed protein product, partial [Cylicocyclus nassatus]
MSSKGFTNRCSFDGIWIDLDEPVSFATHGEVLVIFGSHNYDELKPIECAKSTTDNGWEWDVPPYPTGGAGSKTYLASGTLCMLAKLGGGAQRLYDAKNLYALSEAKVTLQALYEATKKRGYLVSRFTFVSSGRYAGHLLFNTNSTWEDLRRTVVEVQRFNMFGIPYVGSDICGYEEDTTEELCLRWQQLGAFHSFMRNFNGYQSSLYQYPSQWSTVRDATINANRFRYRYMPYLYSLHFKVSLYGGTVIRPLFFEYPKDPNTYRADYQFLWGRSMLVAPVVYEGEKSVDAYVPEDDWYSLYDYNYGQRINSGHQNLLAPWTFHTPVLIRGGSIIPRQHPEKTTDNTRKNPFELLIVPGERNGSANGFLYWDDGESIIDSFDNHPYYSWIFLFSVNEKEATLIIEKQRKAESLAVPK